MLEKMALVLSNFASPESARSVLRILMQEQIATCGNIFASHLAIYPWDEKIQEEQETAVLFKAAYKNKELLVKRLRELHPYDLPAIMVIETEANADYVAWLNNPNGYVSKK